MLYQDLSHGYQYSFRSDLLGITIFLGGYPVLCD